MLYQSFIDNTSGVINRWPHYFPVYERHLRDYVNKSIVMFEIGVLAGGSLSMWSKYLGPLATIVGIDINPECARHEKPYCKVRIGDQSDTDFLQSLVSEFGTPDIVIDDGSHMMKDLHNSFTFLYPLLNNNGVYIVEDLHTAYWEEFGGGWRHKDSFIERAKGLVDYLNAYHSRMDDKVNDFTSSTFSICFYDSMAIFEKRRRSSPLSMLVGNPNV